jgi:hypothetical protein
MHDREDAIRAMDELLQTCRGLVVGHQRSLRESYIVGEEAVNTSCTVRRGAEKYARPALRPWRRMRIPRRNQLIELACGYAVRNATYARISTCVKTLATPRRRHASAHPLAEAISCAPKRDLWDPPAATAAARKTSAGLVGLLA